jgi:hypothetical protein
VSAYESADLLLKLYELRREATMREARAWYALHFNPESADDVSKTMTGPDSGHFRMVTSYWDMAASFVSNGAIDEQMFNDANGEHLVTFAKIEPFLAEYRTRMGNPAYLASLEKLVMKTPDARARLAGIRERFRQLAATMPRP